MTIIASSFGNGVDVGSGGNVTTTKGTPHNNYGTRDGFGADGRYKTEGVDTQLALEFTGADINAGTTQLIAAIIPKNALITRVIARVKQAFVLGGTTPTILIGTLSSESTNGVSISAAQSAALAMTGPLTQNGTWAATTPLAAATTVSVVLGGTSPTVTSAGRVEVIIYYSEIPSP